MAQIKLDAREDLTARITDDAEYGALHLILQMTEAGWTDTVKIFLGFDREDAGRAAEALEKAAAQARDIAGQCQCDALNEYP